MSEPEVLVDCKEMSSIQRHNGTYKLTAIMTACTRQALAQPGPNLSTEAGGGHEVPLVSKELVYIVAAG